jgi:hypothetical protein
MNRPSRQGTSVRITHGLIDPELACGGSAGTDGLLRRRVGLRATPCESDYHRIGSDRQAPAWVRAAGTHESWLRYHPRPEPGVAE